MKAVIMCGGVGSRLRPLTENTPKPLIKLMNVPVLEIIIRRLTDAGINDIYLSLGYKAQDIIAFCERKKFGAQLHYCEEAKPLGTAGGVKNCLRSCEDTVLVLSGDNVFSLDLHAAEKYHRVSDADVTVVGVEVDDPREYGVILKDAEGNVQAFQEKPTWEKAESFLCNTGIYFLKGKMLDLIPQDRPYDFSTDLFPVVIQQKLKFMCYHTDGLWGDIGEFEAYRSLSADMLKYFTAEFPYSGTLYTEDTEDADGNRILAPCLVGKNASLGKNNRLGPYTVIGEDFTLGDHCSVKGSIVGDNVRAESGTDVTDAVIDDEATLEANCVIEPNAVLGYGCRIGKFSRVGQDRKIWPGRRISPESIVSRDMFYETPQEIQSDSFGMSGAVFSQFSLGDAVKLGQAIASVKGVKRIGVGGDISVVSGVYRAVCCAGIRSCGVICYDFEEIFQAQAVFYGAYCSLDAFIHISVSDATVRFSFFGRGGTPVDDKTARAIGSRFRFSSFGFSDPAHTTETLRMHLLSTAYVSMLQRTLNADITGRRLHVECENPLIADLMRDFFGKCGAVDDPGGIQFLVNGNGTDMYCIENERFYSSDRIKAVLCELSFAEGKDVVIGEDAPDFIEERAAFYGRSAVRLVDNTENAPVDEEAVLNSLWNFDAVFLCARLLGILTNADISLEELTQLQRDFSMRKRVVEIDSPPSKIRSIIEKTGAVKNERTDAYYSLSTAKGSVRLRQLGNGSRIKVLVQAADMEAAKEVSMEILSKIHQADIDNESEK